MPDDGCPALFSDTLSTLLEVLWLAGDAVDVLDDDVLEELLLDDAL
ncbi:MAG: hypothetical protein KBT53_02560 [Porticoccus sp.]|nr:hypothetical protein [Porticoccus sp.]MBQ0807369.1 hypothetical protein [Porticoccus sp.]